MIALFFISAATYAVVLGVVLVYVHERTPEDVRSLIPWQRIIIWGAIACGAITVVCSLINEALS